MMQSCSPSPTLSIPPSLDSVEALRAVSDAFSLETTLGGLPHMEHTGYVVDTLEGSVEFSVFTNKGSTSVFRQAVYIVHGGGQISGTRFSAVDGIIRWFDGIDIVAVCVENRVAPEHSAPAALNDS
jgi:acetyl esterase/lipase